MTVTNDIFAPISSVRTFEMISSNIKELVFSGVLKSGDKLPSEGQLSQQFKVGRQTIREALRLLELSGFITVQKGSRGGPIVHDSINAKIKDLILDAFRMKQISLEDLTTARIGIEQMVVSFAIDNHTAEDVGRLKENLKQANAKIKAKQVATEENFIFHKLVAEASHNHVFVICVEVLMTVHADFLKKITPDFNTSKQVVEAHIKILDAIIKKDKTLADKLMHEHLIEVQERLSSL